MPPATFTIAGAGWVSAKAVRLQHQLPQAIGWRSCTLILLVVAYRSYCHHLLGKSMLRSFSERVNKVIKSKPRPGVSWWKKERWIKNITMSSRGLFVSLGGFINSENQGRVWWLSDAGCSVLGGHPCPKCVVSWLLMVLLGICALIWLKPTLFTQFPISFVLGNKPLS